jgi:signal recognition particle subunit SRP54
MFENLTDKLQDVFDQLGRQGKLSEADVDKAMREVRLALLEADVNLKVAKDFIKRIKERAIGAEVTKSLSPAQQVIKIVNEELIATLGEAGSLQLSGPSPRVIMMVGLQGSGKTTTSAKLALHLRRQGKSPFLIAADTYRPAAVDQLVTLARQINVPYWEEGTSTTPPEIVRHGLVEAKKQNATVVMVDTAGRLQIDETMMDELEAIKALANPAEILLVADSMTGQEAVRIAEGFNEKLDITGLILTKVDGDARGGAAISMRAVTGVPIKFLATGEKLDALEVFHPDRLASRILGMGDILSLIEKAESTFDQREAEKMQRKMLRNEFTLEDFLSQMQQVKRLGSIGQLLDMIPGMGRLSKDVDLSQADDEFKKIEAIIRSMTAKERNNPRILNASRKRRIAAGSGTRVQDVNALLKQFKQMQRMMKQFSKGRLPNIPGLG